MRPPADGIAADQPGRDAIGCRIGEVGQPAVPVTVVEQDRAGSVDIDLGQRLRLGDDVLGRPVRVLCGDPCAVGLEVADGSSDGSLAICEMSAWGTAGGSSRTSVAGRIPLSGNAAAVIPPQLWPTIWTSGTSRPAARIQAATSAALSRNR